MKSKTFMRDSVDVEFAVGSNGKRIRCKKCGEFKIRCPGCKRIVCYCSRISPRGTKTGHLVSADWITCFKG